MYDGGRKKSQNRMNFTRRTTTTKRTLGYEVFLLVLFHTSMINANGMFSLS